MKKTALEIKNRINLLKARGETMNAKIIKKAERQLRKIEAQS